MTKTINPWNYPTANWSNNNAWPNTDWRNSNPLFNALNPSFNTLNPAFNALNPAFNTLNPTFNTLNDTTYSVAYGTPSLNVSENSRTYTYELATPGYNKDSFEVSFSNDNNTLVINGKRNNNTENETEYSYREYNFTSFTREINLPNNVNISETRANYENGILTVIVPKNTENRNTVRVS